LKFSFHDFTKATNGTLKCLRNFGQLKNNRKQVQYRIVYKALTLGGILTLSKDEHLSTLFCAVFF